MKDTFYFSHDYNARTDVKIKRLIAKHELAGYGLFWCIVEDLYNNANALPLDCESIAYDLRTNEELVRSVIHDFDLFAIEGNTFGSVSVERRLNERNVKSKKAKESADLRWKKHREDANALRTHCEGNAIKERKGKEIKESKYWERPIDFLKKNEIEFEQVHAKSRLSDFEECAEQWSLGVEGSDFAYSDDPHEDYRKLKARFQKWINSWAANKLKPKIDKVEKIPDIVKQGKAQWAEVDGKMLVKPLGWKP